MEGGLQSIVAFDRAVWCGGPSLRSLGCLRSSIHSPTWRHGSPGVGQGRVTGGCQATVAAETTAAVTGVPVREGRRLQQSFTVGRSSRLNQTSAILMCDVRKCKSRGATAVRSDAPPGPSVWDSHPPHPLEEEGSLGSRSEFLTQDVGKYSPVTVVRPLHGRVETHAHTETQVP